MFTRSKILLIILVFFIGIAFLSIILLSLPKPSPVSTPAPIPAQSPIPTQSLPPQPAANTKPPVRYDFAQLLNIQKTRPALSASDAAIRAKLIESLSNKSGILNKTEEYILDYVKAPDLFQVEILITDFNTAKTQATEWFKSEGLSLEGICKLPVMFYLNRDAAEQLREQNILFNPLPEGC